VLRKRVKGAVKEGWMCRGKSFYSENLEKHKKLEKDSY
jgi:hypothetical protein